LSVFHQPVKLALQTKPVASFGRNAGMQTVIIVVGLTWTEEIRKEYIP